jgi:hypothetical protein
VEPENRGDDNPYASPRGVAPARLPVSWHAVHVLLWLGVYVYHMVATSARILATVEFPTVTDALLLLFISSGLGLAAAAHRKASR